MQLGYVGLMVCSMGMSLTNYMLYLHEQKKSLITWLLQVEAIKVPLEAHFGMQDGLKGFSDPEVRYSSIP